MEQKIKYIKEISIVVIIIVVLLIFYLTVLKVPDDKVNTEGAVTLETLIEEDTSQTIGVDEADPSESQEVAVVVDVKGAVMLPGVFTLNSDQRVIDAIESAGGVTEQADTKHINFAQLLEDEMYVYIPEMGEDISQLSVLSDNKQTHESMININNADESELLLLDGIGPSKAAEIIKYREENGAFNSIEELTNVSGIGEKTFEKIKENIEAN